MKYIPHLKKKTEREQRIHTENQTKKREKETKNTIKTQVELSKAKAPRINTNLVRETQIEQ